MKPTKTGFYFATITPNGTEPPFRTVVRFDVEDGLAYITGDEVPTYLDSVSDWSPEIRDLAAIPNRVKRMRAEREVALLRAEERGGIKAMQALFKDLQVNVNAPLNGRGIALAQAALALVITELELREAERGPKVVLATPADVPPAEPPKL